MKAGPKHSHIPLGPHHVVKKFQSMDPNFRSVVISGWDGIPVLVLVMVWLLSLYWEPDSWSTAKTSFPSRVSLPRPGNGWSSIKPSVRRVHSSVSERRVGRAVNYLPPVLNPTESVSNRKALPDSEHRIAL